MSFQLTKENKPAALVALYNHAQTQGMGIYHFTPEDMTIEEATELVGKQTYFDYVHGRILKVNFREEEPSFAMYNRDNGEGAAEIALMRAGLMEN